MSAWITPALAAVVLGRPAGAAARRRARRPVGLAVGRRRAARGGAGARARSHGGGRRRSSEPGSSRPRPAISAPRSRRRRSERTERSWAPLPLALAGSLLLAIGWGSVHEHRVLDAVLARISGPVTVEGSLRVDPSVELDRWSAVLDVRSVRWDEGAASVRETVWLSGRDEPPDAVRGDRLRVSGSVRPVDDAGFASFLLRRGIAAELEVDEAERLGPAAFAPVRWAQSFRALAGRSIESSFPPREAGLLMGLALGDDSRLDPVLERDFRATGLSHLLVVSGENVAMVLAPIVALGAALGWSRWPRFALGMGTVAFFVVLTGAEPSVMRAGVMAGLALIGVLLGRPRSTGSILAGAVVVLLVLDPGARAGRSGSSSRWRPRRAWSRSRRRSSTRLRFLPVVAGARRRRDARRAGRGDAAPAVLLPRGAGLDRGRQRARVPRGRAGAAARPGGGHDRDRRPGGRAPRLDPRAGADALPRDRRRPSRPGADPVDHGRRRAHAGARSRGSPRSSPGGCAPDGVCPGARSSASSRSLPLLVWTNAISAGPAERAHGPVLRRRAGRLGAAHLAGRRRDPGRRRPRSRPGRDRARGARRQAAGPGRREPPARRSRRRAPGGARAVPGRPAARAGLPRRLAGRCRARRGRVAASTSRSGTRGRATCSRSATSASRSCRPTAAGPGRSPTRTTTRSSSARASGRTRSCSRPSPRSRRSRCCSTTGVDLHADVLKVPHHGAATSIEPFFEAVDAGGGRRQRRPEHLRPPGPRGPRLDPRDRRRGAADRPRRDRHGHLRGWRGWL